MNLNIKKLILPALFVILVSSAAGCQVELPEPDSRAAKLYLEKCSSCHSAKHPKILPIRIWKKKVIQMEEKVKTSGMRKPLTEEELKIILDYLAKHHRNRAI